MLATFTVTNLSDAAVMMPGDAPGTLRQAIFDANALPGADTIEFQNGLTGTILLTEGELPVSDSLTINGPGAAVLTVDGSGSPAGSRVINVGDGDDLTNSDFDLSGVTITGGNSSGDGGAIRSTENVSISASTITGNTATLGGGGISFIGGPGEQTVTIYLADVQITNNMAIGGSGGGMDIETAGSGTLTVTVENSNFSRNVAAEAGGAAAVLVAPDVAAEVSVFNATIEANSAGTDGGAIFVDGMCNGADSQACQGVDILTLELSDIFNNTANGNGGAIAIERFDLARLAFVASSFDSNMAANGGALSVISPNGSAEVDVQNTNFAANMATGNGGAIAASLQGGQWNSTFNVFDSNTAAADGGAIWMELKGQDYLAHYDSDRNFSNSARNGGAISFNVPTGGNATVELVNTMLENNTAGIGGAGVQGTTSNGSQLNVVVQGSTCLGNSANVGACVNVFGEGQNNVTITNSSISGNDAFAAVQVEGPNVNAAITNASIRDNGGIGIAVAAGGIFNLLNSEISKNSDVGVFMLGIFLDALYAYIYDNYIYGNDAGNQLGGGLLAGLYETSAQSKNGGATRSGQPEGGSHRLTIRDTTVASNSASQGGGMWIRNFGGATSSIINSTISGSVATGMGGGMYVYNDAGSSTTISYSTITGNTGQNGGGLYAAGTGTLYLRHNIVAGNTATSGMGPDAFRKAGADLRSYFSLIGHNANSGFAEAPVGMPDGNGNLIGGPINGPIDPLLGPLADNGGPTLTHALLSGSPAIDAGDPAAMPGVGSVPQFDQRGAPYSRVADGSLVDAAVIDMGAFELQDVAVVTCDFDGDTDCDIDDIDLLIGEIVAGTNDPAFDLTGDGLVNLDDRDQWLAEAGAMNLPSGNPFLPADSNLDGVVDGLDFLAWNANKFGAGGAWSRADFNADGVTDGLDFIIWNTFKFQSSGRPGLAPQFPTAHQTLSHEQLVDRVLAARRKDQPRVVSPRLLDSQPDASAFRLMFL
jgi:predicted outer membrane repeat protein